MYVSKEKFAGQFVSVGRSVVVGSPTGARAHALDGVPDTDELRAAYYRAYDAGAQARIKELYAK